MLLMGLPTVALFVISLTGYLGSEIIKGSYNRQYAANDSESYKYTAAVSGVCAAALLLLSGMELPFSWFSVGLGALFGVAVMGNLCASSLAVRIGPWSYTTVMVSLAIVFPAFSGAIFWNETLNWMDFVGLAFMILCLLFSTQQEPDGKKGSLRWLLLSFLAMVCMAGVGLLQKTHQSSAHKGEITVFLVTALLVASLFSLCIYLLGRRKAGEKGAPVSAGGRAHLLLLTAGLATALNHSINLYLSGALESVVFFPVMCGCELAGVMLASVLLFREKLTARQWLGLGFGAVAVLLLCI